MGNQNTSGIIVEEEKARNEAADNAQEVISPPDAVTVENQSMVQENGVERVESEDKEIEDHKGSVEGSDDVIDISTNGSDLVEKRSKFSDEEQEQPCTFTEDMQNPSPECTTHEAVDTTTSDIQEQQNMLTKESLEADNHNAEKDNKDLVMAAETAPPEGTFSEVRAYEEELGRDDEPPQEEQSNSINAAAENECFRLDHEEKTVIDELGNGDTNHTICVDQYQPCDQEINQFLIRCSSDPMIKDEFKENGDDLLEDVKIQEDKEATDQHMLEKALHWEESKSEVSATENNHKNESQTTEKCESFMKIDTEEAETPLISTDIESDACADVKKVDEEAKLSNVVAQVELRKSPSFDFGISFETRTGDSDQTPLLYQDRTARRSLSNCSNLRFQNQTEYLRKPLQFEAAVQMEEKTILMERSNSKQMNSLINNKKENASPSRDNDDDDNAATSPKGNGRRKARSSLFTTCICCTAAIS